MSLRIQRVVISKNMHLKLTHEMFNPVKAWCSKICEEEIFFSKSLGWRKNLSPMIRQSSTFLRIPKNIFNEGLCPYQRGIWNKFWKLRTIQKIHQFYKITDFIRVELEKIGPSKIIIPMIELQDLYFSRYR